MIMSPSSQRTVAAILVLLSSITQAHADAPAPIGQVFIRESTVIASVDTAKQGTGAAPSPAPPPWMTAPRSSLPTTPPLPKPRPEDAKALLAIMSNEKVCKLPLDLSVENSTLEEIAARVQEKLPPTAPKIEVRDARPIRLSFALKNSTVREVLESAAAIAGARLWVLPDRLLLAPQTSLTKADGTGNSSPGAIPASFSNGWGNDIQRVFFNLIADELTAKAANSQVVAEGTGLLPSSETTFSKLSPEAQEMLRGLVDQSNERRRSQSVNIPALAGAMPTEFILSPTTLVQLNPVNGSTISNRKPLDVLSITESNAKVNQEMHWSTDGSSGGYRISHPLPAKSGAAVPPPFLDPSAHKS